LTLINAAYAVQLTIKRGLMKTAEYNDTLYNPMPFSIKRVSDYMQG